MANLKEIQGFSIQNLTEDPSPYAQALADNPYAGTWASGGNLNTARYRMNGGAGTLTAGLVAGGQAPVKANVELYDGTSWTEAADLDQAKSDGGTCGLQTAALHVGGAGAPGVTDSVEHFNGSSWSEGGDLPAGRERSGTFGTQTSAVTFGGRTPSYAKYTTTLEYNGSSWTDGGAFLGTAYNQASSGTQTAGIGYGGYYPGDSGSTIAATYDGSSWTSISSLNTARDETGWSGKGTQTDTFIAGGTSPKTGKTESWNGSAWTEVNDLAINNSAMGSSGSGSAAFVAGGATPPTVANTEEWTFSGLDPSSTPAADYSDAIVGQVYYNSTTGQFRSITSGGAPIGTWASTNNLNSSRGGAGGAGLQTASLIFGGMLPPSTAITAVTESYDGTSFTEVNDLNTARAYRVGGAGIQTAALAFGGGTAPGADKNETEVWNGSSWTEVNNLNSARESLGGAGLVNTAAIAAGGYDTAHRAYTETWDGTNWTEVNDLNVAKSYGTIAGTSTSSIHVGGYTTTHIGQTEVWDGSSWTETTDLNTSRSYLASSGISTLAIVFGGYTGSNQAKTEAWNGSSWTEVNDMGTARYDHAGTGQSSGSALAAGGFISDETAVAEEFTGADFQIKTLTTS